jgi:hypothetical protein
VRQVVEAIKKHVPDLEVQLVDTKIMNQLSYTVACERFRALGFQFEGNLEREIQRSIELIRNARVH